MAPCLRAFCVLESKAVSESKTSANTSTLGAEIERLISLLSAQLGPIEDESIISTNYWVTTAALGTAA